MDFFIDIEKVDDEQITAKVQLFSKQKDVDLIIFGSSISVASLNCNTLDSINQTNSFNLGIPGMRGHMKLALIKELVITGKIKPNSTVLLESGLYNTLESPASQKSFVTLPRFLYFYTTKYFIQDVIQIINTKQLDFPTKISNFWTSSKAYVNSRNKFVYRTRNPKKMSLLEIKEVLTKGKRSKKEFNENGYLPYTSPKVVPETLELKNAIEKKFESVSVEMELNAQRSAQTDKNGDIYLGRYLELNTFLQKHNIRLIVFSHPMGGRIIEERAVINSLGKEGISCVNFENPTKYPFLYDFDYYFDPGHLNQKGAYAFSMAMAVEINKLLKK